MKLRPTASDGAAALEFALVLPVLAALVLGAIDYGHYFFVAEVVTNAAREGARAGSLQAIDSAVASAEASKAAADYLTRGILDASRATVSVTVGADAVNVTVVYPVGSLTGYFSDTFVPPTARAVAEMRR